MWIYVHYDEWAVNFFFGILFCFHSFVTSKAVNEIAKENVKFQRIALLRGICRSQGEVAGFPAAYEATIWGLHNAWRGRDWCARLLHGNICMFTTYALLFILSIYCAPHIVRIIHILNRQHSILVLIFLLKTGEEIVAEYLFSIAFRWSR